MLRRIFLISIPVAAILGVCGWYFSRDVHYVDPKPATEVGTWYFEDFKSRDVDDAFELYSDEFKTEQGEKWRNFMKGLQTQWGALVSAELVGSSIAPLNRQGCLALFYKTQRAAIVAEEQLLICPVNEGKFRIVGHSLKRLDTNQSVRAGSTVDLASVNLRLP